MIICIDVQSAVTQRAGVGRYTRQLVASMSTAGGPDTIRLFYFDFRGKGNPLRFPGMETRRLGFCPGRVANLAWRHLGWPPFDRLAGKADLYHFPNFTVPPISSGRSIVTIHDMSFFRFPEFGETRNIRHLTAGIHDTVARADAILTVSRFSAREIQDLLDVPSDRVFAVYPGISPTFSPPPTPERQRVLGGLDLGKPYILSVGTLEPRKNIAFLVDLFEAMPSFDGQLVIAGGPGWKYEPVLERMRQSSRAADIRYLEYMDDTMLPALYAGATFLAMPSFYEGFGFPPLEAMACGTPAITSGCGSLAEVTGDAALTVDTLEVEAWAEAAGRLLGDSALRATLVERGLRHAAEFTWQRTARETLDVYRRVIG